MTPHPMRVVSERKRNYRPSEAELAMRARRPTTGVGFSGDIRGRGMRSSTTVRLFLSDDGELNIFEPRQWRKM